METNFKWKKPSYRKWLIENEEEIKLKTMEIEYYTTNTWRKKERVWIVELRH